MEVSSNDNFFGISFCTQAFKLEQNSFVKYMDPNCKHFLLQFWNNLF